MAIVVSTFPADEEMWAVMQWRQYEDGHEEEGNIQYLFPPATEDEARKVVSGSRKLGQVEC